MSRCTCKPALALARAHGAAWIGNGDSRRDGLAMTARAAYPEEPIRPAVPFPPGEADDDVARVVQAALTEGLWPSIVIENRAGASGMAGTAPEFIRCVKADGTAVFTSTPEEFAALMKSDSARLADIVKKTGIRID